MLRVLRVFGLERICHLLNTTKNKTHESQFACIQTPQSPLSKAFILVFLKHIEVVMLNFQQYQCIRDVPHSCGAGCYHQVRSQVPPPTFIVLL